MDKYQSTHTGSEIDTAVDKVLNEELPIASSTKLGSIKVGDNLSITSDGVLSASGGGSGGGTKLYLHQIPVSVTNYDYDCILIVINRYESPIIKYEQIYNQIYAKDFVNTYLIDNGVLVGFNVFMLKYLEKGVLYYGDNIAINYIGDDTVTEL